MEVQNPVVIRTEGRILVYKQRSGGLMQVGDLVRMGSALGFRSGIVMLIDNKPIRGNHTIKVHFLGHKNKKLNGLQWCDPRYLEVL